MIPSGGPDYPGPVGAAGQAPFYNLHNPNYWTENNYYAWGFDLSRYDNILYKDNGKVKPEHYIVKYFIRHTR